jgi:hypothetical protein
MLVISQHLSVLHIFLSGQMQSGRRMYSRGDKRKPGKQAPLSQGQPGTRQDIRMYHQRQTGYTKEGGGVDGWNF